MTAQPDAIAAGRVYARSINHPAVNATIVWGNGTPEGAVAAVVGSLFLRLDGGAATTLYVKESGAGGNTGWVGK